jgi:hypothetical protein
MLARWMGLAGALTAGIVAVALGVGLGTRAARAEPHARVTESRAIRPAPLRAPYGVGLEDENGQRLRTFQHQAKTYVLGHLGERYAVRITNPTDQRVEAVVTVDGRDVLTGRVGGYVHARGYLVSPHDSIKVEGFRQSLDEVAAFRFSPPRDSYSSRLGTPQNVGVIGVAFFPERQRTPLAIPPWSPVAPEAAARESRGPGRRRPSAAGASHARSEDFNLGTQYGESRVSPAQEVPFERAQLTVPARVVVLYYDDARGLEARGIQVEPRPVWLPHAEPGPDPFPESRFAPPPPR